MGLLNGSHMRPIWKTHIWDNPYGTHAEPGCTPHMGSSYGTPIGMFTLNCCSHVTKSGFLSTWLICYYLTIDLKYAYSVKQFQLDFFIYFRLDYVHCASRLAQEKFGIKDPDYYDLDSKYAL